MDDLRFRILAHNDRVMASESPPEPHAHSIETLAYATPLAGPARPVWIYVVLAIYCALILGVLSLPILAGFADAEVYAGVYLIIAVLFLGGLLLVLVPIRARRQRPIKRRAVWLPLAGSAILLAAPCYAVGLATQELLDEKLDSSLHASIIFSAVGLLWLGWIILFWLMSRSLDPVSLSARLYKSVLAGSALELLVAVPMHIVVRRRHECCAGMATGFAICLGVVTAIVALGPGVFFLFHRRWIATYRKARSAEEAS